MTPLIWAIILFVTAMAMFALELFLPSGGILGFLSVASLLGSLGFVLYGYGFAIGTAYLLLLTLLVPVLVVAGLNYWPHTAAGRAMLNVSPDGNDEPPVEIRNAHLVGKYGTARTKMLPSGLIEIEGKRYDAVADGTGIDPGDTVEVISVDGTQIVVREVEPGSSAVASSADPTPDTDALSRPASEVIQENPFEEPPPV